MHNPRVMSATATPREVLVRTAALIALIGLTCSPAALAQTSTPVSGTSMTVDQMKTFLKTAKVVKVGNTSKGVTSPHRLTLSDGDITHDAVFQAIDEHKQMETLGRGAAPGTTELNFVDSYKYNIAAYELARLVGLEEMMPVYVERRWNGQVGSLSWFVPTLMDEGERLKKKLQPPNAEDWNNQMYRMRVFAALVRDTDRNLTNVLITPQWKIVMIDFTRGFRLQPELLHQEDLKRIDRALLAKLEALSASAVTQATRDFLAPKEIDAMMVRRDLIVTHYKALIDQLGADKVLY